MTNSFSALLIFFFTVVNLAAAQPQGKSDTCPRDDKDFVGIQQRADSYDPVAQTALASCYDLGMHVQPNGKESIRWLSEAANLGYAPAEYELGRIYLYGRGIEADYAQALLWERKAAEQGDPRAQLRLAQALENGDGIPKDEQEARLWYTKAGVQNVPEAQLRLGHIYAQQVPEHCREAKEWYGRAALTGDAEPMNELGTLYMDKKCNTEGSSDEAAYMWFSLGGRFGSRKSRLAAEILGPTLKPAQKRNADQAIAHWLKEYAEKQEDEEEEKEER
jgi:TPR repeat protein